MNRGLARAWEGLHGAILGLLPTIPYAPAEIATGGPALRAQGLTAAARPDGPVAFTGIAFEIPTGCRTALVGPNGSGKSTLLRVIAGLTPARAGRIEVLGHPPALGRRRVAYLAQRPALTPDFPVTLRRLVQMGKYAHHGWFDECGHGDADVDRALRLLELTELADRPVHALSGGQLQRGLLARATVQGAELLLLDEPYAALDAGSRAIVERFLDDRPAGLTVVMATHDPADARRSDRVLELRDGALRLLHACDGHDHRHA
jgi:manganese/zinc/iron transport system ATP- binding protein